MKEWIVDRSRARSRLVPTICKYGFAIVPNALSEASHRRLYDELNEDFETAEFCEGLFYGLHTKRFGRLLSRSEQCQRLALNELAILPAQEFLGEACQQIQLNLSQAIEIGPGSPSQVPHRDQDIWLGVRHAGELMVNAMWALDDFTQENGATMVWPGTHLEPGDSQPMGEPVFAAMPKGSLCLFLGSTLHCGGANWSMKRRRGLVMSYCLGWLKPCENPWLSYPPEVARHFPEELGRLIGYRMDTPSLNNVEGRCPSELLRENQAKSGFADRLTAEQILMIEQFNQEQLDAQLKAA